MTAFLSSNLNPLPFRVGNYMNQMEQKRPLLRAAFEFFPRLYGYLFFIFCACDRETQPKKARSKKK
jgi:hypothetical protein